MQTTELARGRRCCEKRLWADAFAALSLADEQMPLDAEDLERLATSAYLTGRETQSRTVLNRAHDAYLKAGKNACAIRCAFWLGMTSLLGGETARGTGWLTRARYLIEREATECVEQGYLLLPEAEQHLQAKAYDAASAIAADAAEIGHRFGEADLVACARHLQGRALIGLGSIEEGLALLDEAMVVVTSADLFPVMAGLIYCSVIDACQQVYASDRATEWTSALEEWCKMQPQMVAFTATCLVHRAEIKQMHGAWQDAIEEARRATARPGGEEARQLPPAAFYRQAEVHRLRGEFEAAEAAYQSASQRGLEPQPGLALLRLAQGRARTAAAALRRVMAVTTDPQQRVRLLPAFVDIMVAVRDLDSARTACRELSDMAQAYETEAPTALAAHAQGAVALAEGDAQAALGALRRALELWQHIEAPYEAARVRVLSGLACRALGDREGAALELAAARGVFEQLGAAPDIAHVEALARGTDPGGSHGLTSRELQVLRLVAAGRTNKAIAAELFLSERTVDRHVSNILDKLGVSSRAAATAFAYEHGLV
jgi:DNA-binding NarL/FixJ family response regulator